MSNVLSRPFAAICLFLAACASAPVGDKSLLDFLNDGVTRREDVYLKLGEPTAQFDASRIVAYRLAHDEGGYSLVGRRADWRGVRYNLVLVFDTGGVLRRHALVEVRSP